MTSFSIKEAILFGFKTTKKHFPFLLVVMGISFASSFLTRIIGNFIDERNFLLIILISIIAIVIQLWIGLGVENVSLRLASEKKVGLKDIFSVTDNLWSYILATILLILLYITPIILGGIIIGVIGAGLIVAKYTVAGWVIFTLLMILVITGFVYIHIRTLFIPFIILEEKISGYNAIKKSFALTKKHVFQLFLFSFALFGVTLLGLLALVAGLFVAYPTVFIATAYTYKKLAKKS